MLEILLRGTSNGIPGIVEPSTVLCPVPGKVVTNIEGFHIERRYDNVNVTDPLIITVLNEIYLLKVFYSYVIGGANSLNLLTYSLNFPPTINQPVTIVSLIGGLAVRQNVIQVDILCSELTAVTSLPGGADYMTVQAIGYKLILQDI